MLYVFGLESMTLWCSGQTTIKFAGSFRSSSLSGSLPRGPSRLSATMCATSAITAPGSSGASALTRSRWQSGNAQIPPDSRRSRFISVTLIALVTIPRTGLNDLHF